MIFVTGGAGFIGANFVLDWLRDSDEALVNLDKLTYAGNFCTLQALQGNAKHIFVRADIADRSALDSLLANYRPRALLHFAAETHVDRAIHGPADFVHTNVAGTSILLEATLHYWNQLNVVDQENFRFLHVSTDEVYGSLGADAPGFLETTAYAPNNLYAATKAGADHLVRAYHHTYGLPTLTTNCSNNYGPYQLPEKLIPLVIARAIVGGPLPIYGDGQHVRDWLFVSDHCSAIRAALMAGRPGETYNVGSSNERTNLAVVNTLCGLLDRMEPKTTGSYSDQITFVADRLGHDRRYAIDATKIRQELKWQPLESFDSGMEKTVRWYLDNPAWIDKVMIEPTIRTEAEGVRHDA